MVREYHPFSEEARQPVAQNTVDDMQFNWLNAHPLRFYSLDTPTGTPLIGTPLIGKSVQNGG